MYVCIGFPSLPCRRRQHGSACPLSPSTPFVVAVGRRRVAAATRDVDDVALVSVFVLVVVDGS